MVVESPTGAADGQGRGQAGAVGMSATLHFMPLLSAGLVFVPVTSKNCHCCCPVGAAAGEPLKDKIWIWQN